MPYDPNGLFTGAAPYYAAYRPGYPPERWKPGRVRWRAVAEHGGSTGCSWD